MRGCIIKKEREENNLSLEEFAEQAGLPVALISDIELGKKEPSAKILNKITAILDISEEELYDDKDFVKNDSVSVIGEKIRAMREKNKLKLGKLAELSGISLTYISEIERGTLIPPVETIRKIAEVFKVPVSIFLAENKTSNLIASKMKKARKARGLSQKELAEKAGVSAGLVGQLEMGKVNASFKTLKKLSEVLGVSVCYLILEQEEVEEMIGGLGPDLRNMLYDPKVQLIIGSICQLEEEQLKMALNFIDMLKNPAL